MTYKQYLLSFFLGHFLLISSIAFVNYTIDPGSYYSGNNEKTANSTKDYAEELLKSDFGLLFPRDSWNTRDIKNYLAIQISGVECAIIGSSHILQISSFSKTKSLVRHCETMINLGVAGATLEDYLALSWKLINNPQSPKTIVFGIDVWSLDYNRDPRWFRYKQSYESMRNTLLQKDGGEKTWGNNIAWEYIKNLINPNYFYRSMIQIGENHPAIRQAPDIDHSSGFDVQIYLPDGSIVRTKDYIEEGQNRALTGKGVKGLPPGLYKIRRDKKLVSQINPDAVNLFSHLVSYLQSKGKKIVFALAPYHHDTWSNERSLEVKGFKEVEPLVRKLGKESGVEVLGSFHPEAVGCSPNEFHDYMHATASCTSKL